MASTNGVEFLRLTGVHAFYGESHILHGVDLTVNRGEVVTLLGRNGAGRTTTLKSILGLVGRRSGSIMINGREAVALPPHRIAQLGIGYCPEERGIFASLSCEENLLLPPQVASGGMDLAQIYAMFPNLKERAASPGTRLSGGEQQMLAVARILRTGAKLLLLDEISEGLAPVIVQALARTIRMLREKGLTTKREIRVQTLSGVIVPRLEADGQVTVDMGPPTFEPARIPFIAERRAAIYALEVDDQTVQISALSMGNPHAVQVVDDVDSAPVLTQGPRIERHPRFPQRVNAGYVQVIDRGRIRLRVFERGAGETLACGTGACAAVVAGIERGLLDATVQVETRGGALRVAWEGDDRPVFMTGPAETVFEGEIDL